jgi:Cdc6-like AAA superfamily ATPase
MNIEERIARRQRTEPNPRLVLESDALNPVAHPTEPTGRGLMIEQLLDAIELVFDDQLPADCYLWGPKGAGKSAVISALFTQLDRLIGRSDGHIYTTTRAEPTADVAFVYVDARQAKTGFALLHAVLDSLVSESVPKQGVGTETILNRLRTHLETPDRHVIIAVDHVGESETLGIEAVYDQFKPFSSAVATVLIGRMDPDTVSTDWIDSVRPIRFEPYRRHTLIEILTSRETDGLIRSAVTHQQLRSLATWANGDAHDALAALFGAGLTAEQKGHKQVDTVDLTEGMNAVPQPCVSLGRVLALPESRQQVLSRLIGLPKADRNSVSAAADAITDAEIDLSRATIERVLYELAEAGIIRRVKLDDKKQIGRPPSRLESRFPTLVFDHLSSVS